MEGGGLKVSRPFQVVSVDLIGPLPRSKSGYSYILVILDCFSKFVLTTALRTAKAPSIVKYLEESLILMFGAPDLLICDNGVQFRSHQFKNLLQNYNINVRYTPYYHPQANPVERVNRTLKTMLRCYVQKDQRTWDRILAKISCAIRTSKHEATGRTPYFVAFGREMEIAGSGEGHGNKEGMQLDRTIDLSKKAEGMKRLWGEVQLKLDKAYEVSKRVYNMRRRPVQYQLGQKVWKRNFLLSDATKGITAKLSDRFVGPFTIRRKVGYCVYELCNDRGESIGMWHVQDLKPFLGDDEQ